MIDLITTFAEARFGKQAAEVVEAEKAMPFQRLSNYLNMPQLTPTARKIRDMLEQSISEEKRLKQRAGKATEYARYRLGKAQTAGKLGWLEDAVRAAIPGLSISAAVDASIEKEGADPEESLPGRAFDVAHLVAGLGGAGVGGAAGAGMLGGVPGAARLKELVDPEMLHKQIFGQADLSKELQALVRAKLKDSDLALAAQRDIPQLTRLTEKFSPSWWKRRLHEPSLPLTAEAAREAISKPVLAALKAKAEPARLQMIQAARIRRAPGTFGTTAGAKAKAQLTAARAKYIEQLVSPRKELGTFFKRLPEYASVARTTVVNKAKQRAMKGVIPALKGKGKIGAVVGAILAMSPFVLARLFKTRRLRAKGGTAAESAAEKAQESLAQAGKLKSWREQQLAQLAGAGGPEGYKLLPKA